MSTQERGLSKGNGGTGTTGNLSPNHQPPLVATVPRPTGEVVTSGENDADDSFLQVQNVKISYQLQSGVVYAVADATFDMRRHERLMLIGPSGCGKSTLLKAIAGFLYPTAGTIRFEGRTNLTPGPDRAVVFQEFDQLFTWRTVLGNVVYPLRVIGYGRREATERAREFIQMIGLGEASDRYPHQLSGGMKQRVAIARALALEPKMLLMDEPFGSLDAITRGRLQRELKRIADQTQVAMLFVTHSIQEAMTLGDRIVVLGSPPSRVQAIVNVQEMNGPADARYLEVQAQLHGLLGAGDEELHGVEG